MFEGKRGPKIYKRKKDAEIIAEMKENPEEYELKILEINISDKERAIKIGASVHPDLSIASRKPKEGEKGWIVVKGSENITEEYEKYFEIISEFTID